MNKDCVGIRRH